MIAFLEGNLDEINPSYCTINVNGVGYYVNITLKTYSQINQEKSIKLYTQMIVREDAQLLYGFSTLDEKEAFNILISVNGVGPSSAMMMLATLSVGEIKNAILSGNANLLQTVKGIGGKTAQRIIIDLKDKINNLEIEDNSTFVENKIKNEALNALEVLGISRKQAEKQIDKIIMESPDSQLEDVIRMVLKNLR